jgi:hypothetical protein
VRTHDTSECDVMRASSVVCVTQDAGLTCESRLNYLRACVCLEYAHVTSLYGMPTCCSTALLVALEGARDVVCLFMRSIRQTMVRAHASIAVEPQHDEAKFK